MKKPRLANLGWEGTPREICSYLLNTGRLKTRYRMYLKVLVGRMFSNKHIDLRLWIEAKGSWNLEGPTERGFSLNRENYLHLRAIMIPKIDNVFGITPGELDAYEERYWLLKKLDMVLDEENKS